MMDAAAGPDRWFFIIGCQRSGTTLMKLVLECHSRIDCLDEGLAYRMLAGLHDPHRRRPLLGLKVPCLTEQFDEASMWDPVALPEIANVYQRQPLIVLVRDVRDTLVSMRALRTHERPWIEDYLEPTLRAKRERDAAFAARYVRPLAEIDAASYPALARAAFYWRYKTEAAFDYLARGFPTLVIRYEDLVTRPRAELQRVCAFLRVPWEPALLAHAREPHGEIDEDGFAIGGTSARRPINGLSVGRWRQALGAEEAAEVLRFAGPRQSELYPPEA